MNIESYTIIFLKKQKYLNLPGIGNFRLIKSGDKEKVEFSPVSIIDDHFASFIGVNENVSSNNAANAISRYARDMKNALKEGRSVNIPGLGTLNDENGKIAFNQEEGETFLKPMENRNFRDLTFGSGAMHAMDQNRSVSNEIDQEVSNTAKDPIVGKTFQTETYNPAYDQEVLLQENEKKVRQKKLTRNLLSVVLVLAILGILIWAFYSFINNSSSSPSADTPSNTTDVTEREQASPESTDTDATTDSTKSNAASNANEWSFVIKTYDSEISADKREKQLTDYGWDAQKEKADDGNYNILVNIPNDGRTTEDVADSLRAVLNPGGKVYLKP